MDYREALRYIDGFTDYEKRTGYSYSAETFDLRRPRELLALLGDPHHRFPSVLVAGTKGKGSTCAMLASILRASGRRVGLYSQPHLHTFRERIRVDDKLISPEEMARAVEGVVPAVEELQRTRTDLGVPTSYEVATAAAMRFFAEQAPDLVVLEVGLGGRLDATNVVNPLVSVITPISLDHVQLLGNSLGEIAAEKAGIIKEGGLVVCSEQPQEAMEVIRRVASGRGARLVMAGRGDGGTGRRGDAETGRRGDAETRGRGDVVTSEPRTQNPALITHHSSLITHHPPTTLHGSSGLPYRVSLPLLGAHQVANAATAIAVVEQLATMGFPVEREAVEQGLAAVRWPGRLETVCREPLVVVDGAHNGDSAQKLAAALRECFVYRRLILILGTSTDKDVEGIAAALAPAASVLIATRSHHARAAEPERLAVEARKWCPNVEIAPGLPPALARATSLSTPEDLICVTGSLYVVADAREHFGLATDSD